MMRRPPVHPALAQAILDAGGRDALAKIVDCSRQNIEYYERKGKPLPAKFVPRAAKALGRSYYELNPDVFPKEPA
jgi:ketosteroid isomerase-like protein